MLPDIENLLKVQDADKEIRRLQEEIAELPKRVADIEKEKADAHQRTAEDQTQLTEWRAKREQLRGGIDADLLRHYERVAKFRGTGISEAFDHKCATCQVMLRPQTYNEVRTGQHA